MNTSSDFFHSFRTRVIRLDNTRRRMEKAKKNGYIKKADLSFAYTSSLIHLTNYVENTIEELVISMIAASCTHDDGSVQPLVTAKSKQSARRVLYGGRSYIDWFPYGKTKKIGFAFFSGGRPFHLEKYYQKKLDEILLVRNLIAHRSYSALKRFQREILIPKQLNPSLTVGTYLSLIQQFDPDTSSLELYFQDCLEIVAQFCGVTSA